MFGICLENSLKIDVEIFVVIDFKGHKNSCIINLLCFNLKFIFVAGNFFLQKQNVRVE